MRSALLPLAAIGPGWPDHSHVWQMAAFSLLAMLLLVALTILAILTLRHRTPPAPTGLEELETDAAQLALEAQSLCSFIQQTTQLDPHAKPGPQLARLVHDLFGLESAAILDADLREVYRAGDWFDNLEEVLQNIYVFETATDDRDTGLIRRVLRMGKLPIGALLLRGETSALTAGAIASVVAITFDRYHAFANESRTESARRTEQLRATVLDSLAHAYKTPLTAIEAASGGLAAMGSLTPAQTGLVSLIEEQADQLNQLTTRLLKTARLEASDLVPHAEPVDVAPLIEDVVASLRDQRCNLAIKVCLSRDNLSLCCDRNLVVALLTQYVDNACKYADAGTVITIQAVEQPSSIVFTVRSIGPVIPAGDYERVFDRYYRSPASAGNAPGTGIGLSIAKRAAQAHGGHVWVTSDPIKGTTFCASLPIAQEGSVAA